MQTISHCECYVPDNNEWVQATDMGIIRSALTSNRVRGLQNILDYIHLDRHNLAEDHRRRLYGINNRNGVLESVSSFLMPVDSDFRVSDESGDDLEEEVEF